MLIQINLRGSIRQRKDGLFELRTKYGSVYGHTPQELQRKLEKKIARGNGAKGKAPTSAPKKKAGVPTFSEFFKTLYFPYKQTELAPKTLRRIEYNFNFIVKQGFDLPMTAYTPRGITEFLLSIPETRKRQIMQGLLNNVFKYAVQMDVLKINPAANVAKMKHDGVKGRAFTFAEQREFFQRLFADEGVAYVRKCYLLFVYLTGARRNEALDLREEDVQDVLHLPGTKTDGSDRYIPLFPLVEKLLQSLTPQDGRYFPFSTYIAESTFKRFSDNHKLHDLRHTFGTIRICVEKLDVKTTSLYMGHSNIQTTLDYYTHPEQLDRAVFLDGKLTEEQKIESLRVQYEAILQEIKEFLR